MGGPCPHRKLQQSSLWYQPLKGAGLGTSHHLSLPGWGLPLPGRWKAHSDSQSWKAGPGAIAPAGSPCGLWVGVGGFPQAQPTQTPPPMPLRSGVRWTAQGPGTVWPKSGGTEGGLPEGRAQGDREKQKSGREGHSDLVGPGAWRLAKPGLCRETDRQTDRSCSSTHCRTPQADPFSSCPCSGDIVPALLSPLLSALGVLLMLSSVERALLSVHGAGPLLLTSH